MYYLAVIDAPVTKLEFFYKIWYHSESLWFIWNLITKDELPLDSTNVTMSNSEMKSKLKTLLLSWLLNLVYI